MRAACNETVTGFSLCCHRRYVLCPNGWNRQKGIRSILNAAFHGANMITITALLDRRCLLAVVVLLGLPPGAAPAATLITAEEAAADIIKGLRAGKFEIHFPRRFTNTLKLLQILPYRWYFALIRKSTGL